MFYSKSVLSLLAAIPFGTLAAGVPHVKNTTALPLHYGLLLLPSFTPIDGFGPLDVLTSLNMWMFNETGKMQLSLLKTDSTPATTIPPLNGMEFGWDVAPTITTDEYLAQVSGSVGNTTNHGPLDVLIIPGGGGARGDVTREVAFVKEVYPSLKYIISVCTGSTILARAGVLDGKRATTNKKAWTWATSFGNTTTYEPMARWVVDGNVYTGSGVSAAVDTAYAFVADVYGEEAAQYTADASEYTRWTNASYDPFAERWGVVGSKTI